MSQGTLYNSEKYARGILPVALIKYFNLDVNITNIETSDEFSKLFPLKKIPAYVGPKGYKLTEVIAVVYYCMFRIFEKKYF